MLLFCLLFPCTLLATPDTFILLRHAEKKAGPNPSLTIAGNERAVRISQLLKNYDIKHIFSSNYNRTLETAKPLAKRLGITVTHYNPRELSALVRQLDTLSGTAVIIGHSNTTPELVKRLSNEQVAINEDQFDHLFIVQKGVLSIQSSNPE